MVQNKAKLKMDFEKGKLSFAAGEMTGFFIGYAIFTSLLYLVMMLSGRSLPFIFAVAITFLIAASGLLLKRFLYERVF